MKLEMKMITEFVNLSRSAEQQIRHSKRESVN